MSGDWAKQEHLNSAVSEMTSSLEELAKEVRALEASMAAGFRRIDALLDAQNVQITDSGEMDTSRLEKIFEPINARIKRLEKRLPLFAALTLAWVFMVEVVMSILSRG